MYTNASDRYKYDATFSSVVDMLRSFLDTYSFTPSELREAVILAATMHDYTRIRPLIMTMNDMYGEKWTSNINLGGTVIGRMDSSKPNQSNTPQTNKEPLVYGQIERRAPKLVSDRRNHSHTGVDNTREGKDGILWERKQATYKDTKRNYTTGDRRINSQPKT